MHGIFPCIHGDRHHHTAANDEKFPDHIHLHRGKTGESVQKKDTVSQFFRKGNCFFQSIHDAFAGHVMTFQIVTKALIQNAHVFHFHLKQGRFPCFFQKILKVFFPHIILHKL